MKGIYGLNDTLVFLFTWETLDDFLQSYKQKNFHFTLTSAFHPATVWLNKFCLLYSTY